jgi:hypothetical protein
MRKTVGVLIAVAILSACGGPTSPTSSTPAVLIDVQAGTTGSFGYPGQ